MKAQPIIDQLQGLGIRRFGGPLEWAALRQAPPVGALPAAYVVFESEAGSESRLVGAHDQRVTADFMVALILEGAARNEAVIDEKLDELTTEVSRRLAGWTHPDGSSPTQYLGGRLLSADGTTLAWAVRFRTAYHLRKT